MDDSGADQCIITTNSFLIYTRTGIFYDVNGFAEGMSTSRPLELVNDAYTLASLSNGEKVIFKINQALAETNPNQKEALLAQHQVRDHGVILDSCAKRHIADQFGNSGGQCITTPEGQFEFNFCGRRCYFSIRKPSCDDLLKYKVVKLTSSQPYEPEERRHTKLRRVYTDVEVADWRAKLGYPTFEITRETLQNTTQLVKTLQAESREYLRDYHKTRAHPLKPIRVDDVMFSDTFFSNTTSIRGYKMFQMFSYKRTKYNVMKLMRRESQVPVEYKNCVLEHGAPNKIVTDNAKALTSNKFKAVSRKYMITTGNTVPHEQHQNYSEGEGGNFKFAVSKCLHLTPHAPKVYWCFCAGFLDKVRRQLSKVALDGRTPVENLQGNTNDISIFRFPWFSPVWYYDPTTSFPDDKMSPGFFLDLAENTGDGFSYVILPVKEVKDIPTNRCWPIVRNIVRPRDLDTSSAPTVRDDGAGLKFFNDDGEEIFGEEELDTADLEDRMADMIDTPEADRELTEGFHDQEADVRDRDSLSAIDGRLSSVPGECICITTHNRQRRLDWGRMSAEVQLQFGLELRNINAFKEGVHDLRENLGEAISVRILAGVLGSKGVFIRTGWEGWSIGSGRGCDCDSCNSVSVWKRALCATVRDLKCMYNEFW